jgi:hypothetical protein
VVDVVLIVEAKNNVYIVKKKRKNIMHLLVLFVIVVDVIRAIMDYHILNCYPPSNSKSFGQLSKVSS